MVSWITPSMRTAGWNAGVRYDTLTCGCRSQVDCSDQGLPGRLTRRHDADRNAAACRNLCSLRASRLSRPLHPTRVWIEDREGRVVRGTCQPRASFAGHVLMTSWDRLHLLYFMATLVGIILPRRFCSHILVSTSARLAHMKNTARPRTAASAVPL